jgi:hypothetical protein
MRIVKNKNIHSFESPTAEGKLKTLKQKKHTHPRK